MPGDGTTLPTNIDATYPDNSADPSVKLHQQHHDALHGFADNHPTDTDPHGDRAYADSAIATAVAGIAAGSGLNTAQVKALINAVTVKTVTDNYTLVIGDAGTMVVNNTVAGGGGGGLVTYINDTFTAANGTAPTSFVLGETGTGSAISIQSNAALITSPSGTYNGTGAMFSTDGATGLQTADIDMTFTFTMTGNGFPTLVARTPSQTLAGNYYGLNLNNGYLQVTRFNNWVGSTVGTPSSFAGVFPGTQYTVRWQIVGNVHTVWIGAGTTPPGTATLTVTDSSSYGGTVLTAAGYAGIHMGGTGGSSATLSVDNLLVTNGATGAAGGSTWVVPKNSAVAFPIGTYVYGAQLGTQQVSIIPVDGTVTVRSVSGAHLSSGQFAQWSAVKIGTDTWLIDGSLS